MFKRSRAGKKALAVFLSIMTAMSLMTVPAFAAEDTTTPVEVEADEGETVTEEYGDVDYEREDPDEPEDAVTVRSTEGGEANVTTGDITSTGEHAGGLYARATDEGSTTNAKTGSITSESSGAAAVATFGGKTNADINGDINASENLGASAVAFLDKSEAALHVSGDVNLKTDDYGAAAKAQTFSWNEDDNPVAQVVIDGDVTSNTDGVGAYAYKGTANMIVGGSVTSTGEVMESYTSTIPVATAATSEAIGEDSFASTIIGGDVTMKGNRSTAVYVGATQGGQAEMTVYGTIKGGEIPVGIISDGDNYDNINLTVWRIEPNKDGAIAATFDPDTGSLTRNEAFEQTINYIIALEGTDHADLTAQDTAHEGEKVVLTIDVQDGYELVNAYNGTGEKVALSKDPSGQWYVIVPRGGGVYLSVELRKKDTDKKDDDKKDDNKNNVAASTSTAGTYASAEAFASAGVSMIASAAPGSTVTIDATSFTSLPASIVAALLARPDVTFVFTYMLNGVKFTVTIPAGTNIAALLNASGGIDFASLASFTAAG